MRDVVAGLMIVLVCVSAANATVLIGGSVQNGDFEDPTSGKVFVDTTGTAIPYWSAWTEVSGAYDDTGVDQGWGGDVNRIMFVQPGAAVKNMTGETIVAGETYTFSMDYTEAGRGEAQLSLVYDNAGVITAITETTVTIDALGTVNGSFTAAAGGDYIGKTIGVGIYCPGNWPEVDNVRLETASSEIPFLPTPPDVLANPETPDILLDTHLLSWNNPTSGYTPSKYVLNFRSEDPNWVDPVNTTVIVDPVTDLNLDGDPNTTEAAMPVTLAYDTAYYWRVDAYEPNDAGPDILHTGDVWSFITEPQTPVVTDPLPVTEPLGETATLTVTHQRGTSYKWFKGGDEYASGTLTEDGDIVLTFFPLAITDEGYYHCEVYNSAAPEGSPAPEAVSEIARLMAGRLVGWWKLDGNLIDSVNDDPEITGAPTHDGSSIDPNFVLMAKDGGGLALSGQPEQLVVIPDSNDYHNFYPQGMTASLWVKTASEGWNGVLSKQYRTGTFTGWSIDLSDGSAAAVLRGSHGDMFASDDDGDIYDEQWHLITYVIDPDTQTSRLYVDGLLRNESDVYTTPTTNPRAILFGAEAEEGFLVNKTVIDDVRIYSLPLKAEAIAQLYTDFNPGLWLCLNRPSLDTTGPDIDGDGIGDPDCKVDLYELMQIAETWLECGRSPDELCR